MGILSKFMQRLGDREAGQENGKLPAGVPVAVGESTSRVQRFKRNTAGRDFVVADLHGAFDLLIIAMAEVDFDPEVDRVFSTGDLIDRGDSSHRCVEFIALPYFHSTLGNHEAMLLDLYMHGNPPQEVLDEAAKHNGFEWWLKVAEDERQKILEAVRSLPHAIEVETGLGVVGIIHADVPKKASWSEFIAEVEAENEQTLYTCLWGRDRIDNHDMRGVPGIARVFVGHTPQWRGMGRYGNVYALDTGAAFGLQGDLSRGRFTMVRLDADDSLLAGYEGSGAMIDIRST